MASMKLCVKGVEVRHAVLVICPRHTAWLGLYLYQHQRAEVAQLAEHSPEKAGVDSSILSLGTIFRVLTDCST